jgi:alkylation response protein AidB-like acyl-CoA dehydrogenase
MTAAATSRSEDRLDGDERRVRTLVDRLLADSDPRGDRFDFMGTQFDLGLAWVHFPAGFGGLGLAPRLQTIVDTALDEATPHRPRSIDVLGHGMGAPTLLAHGTDEQNERWLRPMFTGEEVWCQLFSEPGAGSDVAGLSTRAERDGDEWVVNGQKVWTTVAQLAKWGMVVTRTDPQLPKHQGMTYFIMDMRADGVEVRPLRQITGEAEFNEVYMTDVRIPDAHRIGDRGDGWRVALTTLMNERVAIGGSPEGRNRGAIGDLVELWHAAGGTESDRDHLMKLWVEAEAARLTNIRANEARTAGTPGPEGSTAKLVYAELNKQIYDFATHLLGSDGMLYDSYEPEGEHVGAALSKDIRRRFLRSRANSIEGGTSEIMLNILGERVLGLPGEPRVDKDVPWVDVPRS